MTMGFMPLFMVGFLFTAGPKWLGLPEVDARTLAWPVACMVAGWMVVMLGFHSRSWVAAAGLTAVAVGWSLACLRFALLIARSRAPDREHASLVGVACGIGALCLWCASLSVLAQENLWLRSATQFALWGFVAPVFAVVAHRMLPFFTASAMPLLDAWRPQWLLWSLVGLLWLQAPLVVVELWAWPLPPAWRWAQAAVELPSSILLLGLAVRWGLLQSMRIRLLAMLHAGFVWLGVAFGLAGLSHVLMAVSNGELSLGFAPTHALTMGYLGGTLLAMVTRVSSGHSGRPLAADNPVWVMYWVLHLAAVLRVLAAVWTAGSSALVIVAALAWAGICVAWSLRYGNWYGRIRVDGKPG